MAKHSSKEFDSYIKQAIDLGFTIRSTGVKLILYPPIKEYSIYTAHRGERGIHDLRRFLKKYIDFTRNKF